MNFQIIHFDNYIETDISIPLDHKFHTVYPKKKTSLNTSSEDGRLL